MNFPGTQKIAYIDKTSKIKVLVGTGIEQRIQYIFGGDINESIEGQGFADHLYGAAGNDMEAGGTQMVVCNVLDGAQPTATG